MKKKRFKDRLGDALDSLSLGFVAVAGIGIVLLRSAISRRLTRRHGEEDEFNNSTGDSIGSYAGRSCDHDHHCNCR